MLKVKTTVGEAPLEIEAETKQELEDAFEVALRVMNRVRAGIHNSFREPETPSSGLGVPSTPPPPTSSVGGETPQNTDNPNIALPADAIKEHDRREASEIPKVSYRGAKSIAQFGIIALRKMGELYGTDRSYTTVEIVEFLKKTGGDKKLGRQARPTGAVGQALRNSDEVERHQGNNRLKEWSTQNESEQLEGP